MSVPLAAIALEEINNPSLALLATSALNKLGLELSSPAPSADTIRTLVRVQVQLVYLVQPDPCVTRVLRNFSPVPHPKAVPQEDSELHSVPVVHMLAEEPVSLAQPAISAQQESHMLSSVLLELTLLRQAANQSMIVHNAQLVLFVLYMVNLPLPLITHRLPDIFIRRVQPLNFNSLVLPVHMLTQQLSMLRQLARHAQLDMPVQLALLQRLNKLAHLDTTVLQVQWT
jgi:hypothetical protein